jgi:hypothetical protein
VEDSNSLKTGGATDRNEVPVEGATRLFLGAYLFILSTGVRERRLTERSS